MGLACSGVVVSSSTSSSGLQPGWQRPVAMETGKGAGPRGYPRANAHAPEREGRGLSSARVSAQARRWRRGGASRQRAHQCAGAVATAQAHSRHRWIGASREAAALDALSCCRGPCLSPRSPVARPPPLRFLLPNPAGKASLRSHPRVCEAVGRGGQAYCWPRVST